MNTGTTPGTPASRQEDVQRALRSCSLFEKLSDKENRKLASLGEIVHVKLGKELYRQGDRGQFLFLLIEGHVSLHRKFCIDDKRQASVTVYETSGGDHRHVLGCWCCMMGETLDHMCTAICDSDSSLVRIPCDAIRKALVDNPEMAVKILERLVLQLRDRIKFSYGIMENL
jgi:CRP-like cAMP-binding protein